MEIAPPSSFSQISALFNDYSENDRNKAVIGLQPFETPNIHLFSTNLQQAGSHTGIDVEFRTKDLHEGHRLLNGPLLYPFQDKAQIFNHKFDPFYYDGSELDDNYNVQENLIGTPLGASTLEDPRMTYVKNMLQMKELHGANHPLDDSYIKELYMVNAEKGSNYYQAQLNKLDASMSQYTRTNRFANHKPMQDIQFTYNLATGNPIHEKHTAKRSFQSPSEAGLIQTSRRKKRMERIDAFTAPYNITPVNKAQNTQKRGQDRVLTIEGGTQSITESHSNRSSILLSDSMSQYEEEEIDDGNENLHDRNLRLSSLGTPDTNVTPHSLNDHLNLSREQSTTESPPVNLFETPASTRRMMEEFKEALDNGYYSPANTIERNLFTSWRNLSNVLTTPEQNLTTPGSMVSTLSDANNERLAAHAQYGEVVVKKLRSDDDITAQNETNAADKRFVTPTTVQRRLRDFISKTARDSTSGTELYGESKNTPTAAPPPQSSPASRLITSPLQQLNLAFTPPLRRMLNMNNVEDQITHVAYYGEGINKRNARDYLGWGKKGG
jgi:hypothetical protein